MFSFFKKRKKEIIPLDEVYFDQENVNNFFEKYFTPRVPVLIKGGAQDWSLIEKWNKEYIVKNSGNYKCTVVNDSRPAAAKETTTLKRYFREHENKSTLTLEKFNPKREPYFFKDIPFPNPFFSKKEINRFFFYHSIKDAGTLPHKHGDAFNILQSGTKHWAFFDAEPFAAPTGLNLMNQFHHSYPVGTVSKDWFEKELPLLPTKIKRVYQVIQEAGDIIYVPAHFSHAVLNKSEVMGLVIERDRT